MSKLTLDEAINHCIEVAERYETRAKMIDRRKLGSALENPTACHECAADHRQLAEWLKELKNLREGSILGMFNKSVELLSELIDVEPEDIVHDSYDISGCNIMNEAFKAVLAKQGKNGYIPTLTETALDVARRNKRIRMDGGADDDRI